MMLFNTYLKWISSHDTDLTSHDTDINTHSINIPTRVTGTDIVTHGTIELKNYLHKRDQVRLKKF